MKILLVVSSYLPNLGGLQSVTSALAQALAEQGHDVSVLAQRYPRDLDARETINGVVVRRLLFLVPRGSQLRQRRFDLFLAGLFYFPVTLFRLISLLRRERPDVVNLHFVGAPASFLLAAHALKPFKYVVSLHGDDVQGLSRGTAFDRWVFRQTLRRANAVTACSQDLLNQALKVDDTFAAKSQVIVNGITLPQAEPIQVQDAVLGVGRLMPKKGFDVLLNALKRLKERGKAVRLVLIGDGPERQALEICAEKLALASFVEFRGAQTRDAVYDAMRASKLVVVPSRQEPFGLVALEAMALGKPLVASRVGGLIDVLDGADAELVPPDDAAALADAIETALERIELDPNYGTRNRTRAARFSTDRMLIQYEKTYFSY